MLRMPRDPLYTIDNLGIGAATIRAKDLDGYDLRLLRDSEGLTRDSTGDVGSMAYTVFLGAIADGIISKRSAAFKVDVVDVYAGVDDINGHPAAAGVVVGICAQMSRSSLVANTGEAPGRNWGLLGKSSCCDDSVFFNQDHIISSFDLWYQSQPWQLIGKSWAYLLDRGLVEGTSITGDIAVPVLLLDTSQGAVVPAEQAVFM